MPERLRDLNSLGWIESRPNADGGPGVHWCVPGPVDVDPSWRDSLTSRRTNRMVPVLSVTAREDGGLDLRLDLDVDSIRTTPHFDGHPWHEVVRLAMDWIVAMESVPSTAPLDATLATSAIFGGSISSARFLPPVPRRRGEDGALIDRLADLGTQIDAWTRGTGRPPALSAWIARSRRNGFASFAEARDGLDRVLAASYRPTAQIETDATVVTAVDDGHTVVTGAAAAGPSTATTFPAPGMHFAGFEIERPLGRGGMGMVFRAIDPSLDRVCALKVLYASQLGDEERERFVREARTCSRITHPNVVLIYSAGVEGNLPYFAMEYVEGETLKHAVAKGDVSWQDLVRWVSQVLSGLARFHDLGIVHRDLKPSNIMITADGQAKLMDFGIAHIEDDAELTRTGQILGTVHYMSPEQVRGQEATPASDVFAVGIVLYELLTRAHPFQGEDHMSVMYAIAERTPAPIATEAPIPAELRQIVRRALEKDPARRYPDAAAMDTDLRALIEPVTPRSRKAGVLTLALAATAVLLAGVATWVVGTSDRPDRERAIMLNEQGMDLAERDDLDGAKRLYRDAILADPSAPAPWNNLAMLDAREGDLAEADSLLARAVEADPTYAVAWFNRGNVAWDRERFDEVIGHFERALEADPGLVEATIACSSFLVERGRHDEAAAMARRGLDLAPEPALAAFLHRNLARALTDLGRHDQAVEQWRQVLELGDEAQRATAREALDDAADSSGG